jgi:hypothetical protein
MPRGRGYHPEFCRLKVLKRPTDSGASHPLAALTELPNAKSWKLRGAYGVQPTECLICARKEVDEFGIESNRRSRWLWRGDERSVSRMLKNVAPRSRLDGHCALILSDREIKTARPIPYYPFLRFRIIHQVFGAANANGGSGECHLPERRGDARATRDGRLKLTDQDPAPS